MMTNDTLDEILARHAGGKGALLPILHDVQAGCGHVSEAAVRAIARALNLSEAEVHGVVSFYHDFTAAPGERPAVQVCRAEACQARGVEALVAALPAGARAQMAAVFCLGLCSVGPCAMAGGQLHARLDGPRLLALVEGAA